MADLCNKADYGLQKWSGWGKAEVRRMGKVAFHTQAELAPPVCQRRDYQDLCS